MGFGAVKIYDKAMKLIKKISAKQVSKTFWDNKFRKKDLKLNKQLKSPERDDRLYKKIRTDIITKTIKKKKARDDASKTK
tara:strand:+ start:131 stop:370 length:240 start_codon:yes stop_codon:yes gene_type:complete